MAPYIIIATLFWLFAFKETHQNHYARYLDVLGVCIFVAFAGFRYETGCDWMAYQRYFQEVPSIGSLFFNNEGLSQFGRMEPLFGLVISMMKSIGLNFQALLFIVALFNGVVLFSFFRRYSVHPMFCAAVYFCFNYLPVQMSCMRQSLAYSFVLLGIQALLNGKNIWYYFWIIIGSGFHVTALPFLVLGPILHKRMHDLVFLTFLTGGSIVYIFNIDCVYYLSFIFKFISSSISGRIDSYSILTRSEKTIESMLYLAMNYAFVVFYRNWLNKQKIVETIDVVCLNMCILLVVAQLCFSDLSILWQRFRYIGIIAQACGFTRILFSFNLEKRLLGFCAAIIPSSMILSVYLLTATAQVYVPYQSYITYIITGDHGDGLERSEQFMADYLKYYRK